MDRPSFTFLSWNLAMLDRSDEAPHTWSQEQTELAVRARVLETAPDLVLFQELPKMVPFIETHDMIRANPETHQGNLAILISHEMLAVERTDGGDGPAVTVVPGCGLLITLASGVTVANVHLAPGPGATGERLEQLARIVESSPTPDLAIIGDTNTRVGEIETIAEAGLSGDPPPQATWNSKRNRFHAKGPAFTAYFTRWLVTERLHVGDVKVVTEAMTAAGRRFHLSDHYALTGTVELV